MDSGAAGTSGEHAGPNGGVAVTSGNAKKWRLPLALALIAYGALQTYANIASKLTDNARAGHETVAWQLWSAEISGAVSWMPVAALLWWLVAKIGPSRFSWPKIAGIYGMGSIVASALHVSVMFIMRELIWWAQGQDYRLGGGLGAWPYELRKDLAIYAILLVAFALVEWFLKDNHVAETTQPEPVIITINDGSRTFQVPADEINSVEAAGNYVEVHQRDRSLLHRATMQAMEDTLAPAGFVRIHRSALVRHTAIRTIEVAQSGDFTVELESGKSLRGSRRYRSALD